MSRLLLLALLFVGALARPAAAQSAAGLPARPVPFQFVTDQAKLMAPADAKKLEGGLRRYADQTGTQVVVVTVPSLGGRQVSDYGRALGTAWGVGQRGKNNGLVVIVAAQEHKVTIQPGSGLVDKITPALTQRVIAQDFGPNFKQNNYFAGLRKGLSTLMLAANPASNPNKTSSTPAAAGAPSAAAPAMNSEVASAAPDATSGNMATNGGGGLSAAAAPAESTGPSFGMLALGALGIGVVIWLLLKMFRRSSNTANNAAGQGPTFYPNQPNPNQPNRSGGTPNFLPNSPQGGNYGPGPANYGGQAPNQGGSGFGMGGILATGAAAAAGAYLGNRMSEGHNSDSGSAHNFDTNNAGFGSSGAAGGAAAGAAGTGAAGDYFAGRGGETNESAPDYFSDDNTGNDQSGDYFSSDNSSYDDTSSDDTGGGGFDDTSSDNSGSW